MNKENEIKLTQRIMKKFGINSFEYDWTLRLRFDHRGIENAISKREFLVKYGYIAEHFDRQKEEDIERIFRKFYAEEIPIAYCSKGIFFPIRASDLDYIKKDLRSRALAMFKRWKWISQEHSDLLEKKQRDLFSQEELDECIDRR